MQNRLTLAGIQMAPLPFGLMIVESAFLPALATRPDPILLVLQIYPYRAFAAVQFQLHTLDTMETEFPKSVRKADDLASFESSSPEFPISVDRRRRCGNCVESRSGFCGGFSKHSGNPSRKCRRRTGAVSTAPAWSLTTNPESPEKQREVFEVPATYGREVTYVLNAYQANRRATSVTNDVSGGCSK